MAEENIPISRKEEEILKHHTRRLSIKEGTLWAIKASLGDHFIAPFAVFANMSNPLITIINSMWNINPVAQLFGSRKVKKTNRKSLITRTALTETIGWLFLSIIAVLYLADIAKPILPYLVLINIGLILFSGGFGYPAWFSLIGDVVDTKFRGRWFSKRSTIISFTIIIASITAAFGLEYARNIGKENVAFIILFSLAFLARLHGTLTLNRHYDPEQKIKREKQYSIKRFFTKTIKTNLGHFTIFRALLGFAIGLTSPLVSIYLLRYLNLDYVSYMAIYLSGTLFSIITLNLWGKIADKYGNYKVIALTTAIIPITPILWILSSSPLYLFIVPAVIGGTAWSAFIMSSGNFVYDNTTKDIRAKAISYFNSITGITTFLGGLTSALLLKILNTQWIEPLFLIFIISALLRMLIVSWWIPKIKERKKRESFQGFGELSHLMIREARPTIIEDFHEISSIRKYLRE